MNLPALKAQQKAWIGVSRSRHGKWAEAHKKHAKNQQELFNSWKASVAKVTQINAAIQKITPEAHTASLAIAQAVGKWEGGRSADGLFHPYQDVVHVWTIGYGHTAADGNPVPGPGTHPLTLAEATTLLLHDLNVFYAPQVAKYLKRYDWPLRQDRFDALVDFCYNLGPGYFEPNHDVGAAMKRHDLKGTALAMMEYDRAGGVVLSDLERRRAWEKQLFLGGSYNGAG